ncbi:hypothetical protein E2562_000210 [Oryza meyeriana var. granulata]|uniref:Uncharacterized protein n=1 Tax=Oryza meyeriana var. granulata TaxID=110450 RepID=A0A6G1DBT8_9ORYZ|nr:hypothetical protein E2562_000210 [Oryza meyeriana var. granulata]
MGHHPRIPGEPFCHGAPQDGAYNGGGPPHGLKQNHGPFPGAGDCQLLSLPPGAGARQLPPWPPQELPPPFLLFFHFFPPLEDFPCCDPPPLPPPRACDYSVTKAVVAATEDSLAAFVSAIARMDLHRRKLGNGSRSGIS